MRHVFVDSSRLLCFLIAPPGHHCVRLLSERAVVYLPGLPQFCGCAQCSQSIDQPGHCSCHVILGWRSHALHSCHCIRVFARSACSTDDLSMHHLVRCQSTDTPVKVLFRAVRSAFLSAPSSSLDCLVDEISGLPRISGDVLLMTRSPQPSPSHRNHQIVSSARTAALRRIGYQRQDHVSNQLAPLFCSHPLWRTPHYPQSLPHEHRHERVMQLRTHCTITFRRVPNSLTTSM